MHPAVSTSPAQIQVSVAAAVASGARWPVGTMAAGWIAPFTRQRDVRASVERLACVWLGLAFGAAASFALPAVSPGLGLGVLPGAVLAVALGAVSLRMLPVLDNLLASCRSWVAWLAAHLAFALVHLAELAGASASGCVAGWLPRATPRHLLVA